MRPAMYIKKKKLKTIIKVRPKGGNDDAQATCRLVVKRARYFVTEMLSSASFTLRSHHEMINSLSELKYYLISIFDNVVWQWNYSLSRGESERKCASFFLSTRSRSTIFVYLNNRDVRPRLWRNQSSVSKTTWSRDRCDVRASVVFAYKNERQSGRT